MSAKPLVTAASLLAGPQPLTVVHHRSTSEAARGIVLERNGAALPRPDPSHFYGQKRNGPPKARRIQPMGPMPDRDEDLPSAASAGPFPPTVPDAGTPPNKETAMPKGHYDRSKAKPRAKASNTPTLEDTMKAPSAAEAKPAKRAKRGEKKAPRRPAPSRLKAAKRAREPALVDTPIFGVFNDGSVQINAPECKGRLDGKTAKLLVAFIQRLKDE